MTYQMCMPKTTVAAIAAAMITAGLAVPAHAAPIPDFEIPVAYDELADLLDPPGPEPDPWLQAIESEFLLEYNENFQGAINPESVNADFADDLALAAGLFGGKLVNSTELATDIIEDASGLARLALLQKWEGNNEPDDLLVTGLGHFYDNPVNYSNGGTTLAFEIYNPDYVHWVMVIDQMGWVCLWAYIPEEFSQVKNYTLFKIDPALGEQNGFQVFGDPQFDLSAVRAVAFGVGLPGDFADAGHVTAYSYLAATSAATCSGDVDGSGKVDSTDLNIVLSNFGATCQ